MARTNIELDASFSYLAEPPYTKVRSAQDIAVKNRGFNRIKKWATGSVTLRPINLTTDFVESGKYETLKYRLGDCVFREGWWREVPHNTRDPKNPSDYFYHTIVSKLNAGSLGQGFALIELLNLVARQAIAASYELQQSHGVSALMSSGPLPGNQGYMIRFRIDSRDGQTRSDIQQFAFGDYAVIFHGDGVADLMQTTDFVSYSHVFTFRWCANEDQIYGIEHRLIIFPHHRNQIEFIRIDEGLSDAELIALILAGIGGAGDLAHKVALKIGTGVAVYKCPHNTQKSDGTYEITQPGPWVLVVSREFRSAVQVSRLGFYNGTAVPAVLFDEPEAIGFAPTVPMQAGMDIDYNGCTAMASLVSKDILSKTTGEVIDTPFFSNGESLVYAFGLTMRGLNDIPTSLPGFANMSSATPEFYGYAIDKPALIITPETNPVFSEVISVRLDDGSAPESQTLIITASNADGHLDDFIDRGEIPIRLFDPDSGLTLGEGKTHEVEADDAPAQGPRTVTFAMYGMVDSFMRQCPIDLDFTEDPTNPGYAWTWQTALRRCFEVGGEDSRNVVFQVPRNENAGRYDFPLWREGDSGGAGGGNKASAGSANEARWRPNPQVPIHQFMDHLIRQIMGWNWYRDRAERRWLIYQRPRPADIEALQPLAAFFKNVQDLAAWKLQHPTVPCYTHSGMKRRTRRAKFTSVICIGRFPAWELKSRAELAQLLQQAKDKPDSETTAWDYKDKLFIQPLENPNGYAKPGQVFPAKKGPDWLGSRLARLVNLTLAGNKDAFLWMSRRVFEDLCFGYQEKEFIADWGDEFTYNFKKWDLILIDPDPLDPKSGRHLIDRVEPEWNFSGNRRATYSATVHRPDAPPPR